MTDQLSPLAVQNAPLLAAIKAGPHPTLTALADAAQVDVRHLNRKLASLHEAGLVVALAESGGSHDVVLTPEAERALAAIAFYAGDQQAGGDVAEIALFRIDRSPLNPRRDFDAASIAEMAQSIADKGVLQPIVVRPVGENAYHVVIGERRWRGANHAASQGWIGQDFKMPCRVHDYTDDEALEVAGVENLQREDLHWMDEAEFYLKLAERGRSATEIVRLVGTARKKRSIQDYIKCARELSAEQKALAYRPDGDKDQLSYVRARDLIGEKKERPALDLTPKLALALLEIVDAAHRQQRAVRYLPGETAQASLAKPPVGGPLITLGDRKLIVFAFEGATVLAKVKITEDVAKFLDQTGYLTASDTALLKARAAVIGELHASTLAPGEYVTPELNGPEPARQEPPPSRTTGEGDREAVEGALPHAPTPADDLDTPSSRAPQAGEVEPPPALDLPPDLPAERQIVLIELAHKIAAEGLERGPGTWAVEVAERYYLDGRGQQLVFSKHLAFMPMGAKTLCALTKGGAAWLADKAGLALDPAGRPVFADEALLYMQVDLGFSPERGAYHTPWLNTKVEVSPEVQDAARPPEGAQAHAHPPGGDAPSTPAPVEPPRRDAFAQQILAAAAETRALGQAAAALREARIKLSSATSRRLTGEECQQLCKLIDAALAAAAPHLEVAHDQA